MNELKRTKEPKQGESLNRIVDPPGEMGPRNNPSTWPSPCLHCSLFQSCLFSDTEALISVTASV